MVSCASHHLVRRVIARLGQWQCVAAALLVATFAATPAFAGTSLILQSTTSTDNSGLYDYLLPRYAAVSGTEVRVVAVGTDRRWRMRAVTATSSLRMLASLRLISSLRDMAPTAKT